jgi:copper chaperone CopZ
VTAPAEKTVTIAVAGMHCGNCVAKVQNALRQTPGVLAAEVDLPANQAKVKFNPAQTGAAGLMQAIKTAGFTATGFKAEP